MLIEKEIIGPATHWYKDEQTGLPRKLVVTPELTRYWQDEGNKMLSSGLTVPVPCEHDFTAHPMTPAEKLKNNAGWVKQYLLKDVGPRKDVLFGVCDIQDEDIAKKLPRTIRWTSPWISSFTDGKGRDWKNVITHLALTTRPRVIEQTPFGSVSAALSMAVEVRTEGTLLPDLASEGVCLSKAGKLFVGKKTKRLRPRYPMAFSLWANGIRLAEDGKPFPPKKGKAEPEESEEEFEDDLPDDEVEAEAEESLADPLADAKGDIAMEELLCDLLQALGVPMPDESNESEFKRHLYEAAMSKIKELTSKGMSDKDKEGCQDPDQNKPPHQNPHTARPQTNPLVQTEQQPMYMSLEEINKLPDPTRGVALAMYTENQKLRADMEAAKKTTDSLRDAKLKEENEKRMIRVSTLSRLSPRVKVDLDAMLALPSMALSLGEGGSVVDPMASILTVLEKGLGDMPRLLTTDAKALSVVPQPTDADALTEERANDLADSMARQMGCPPQSKAS